MTAATANRTTSAPTVCLAAVTAPPGPRAAQRLLTLVEGWAYGFGSVLLAVAERLSVAAHLDGRQAAHLADAHVALCEIVAADDARSANLARVALRHLTLAAEADRPRDEHLSICRQLVRRGRIAVRALTRTVEQAAVGRSRSEEE